MTNLSKILRKIHNKPKVKWKRRPEVLLHPNVPKPLHGIAPRVVLGKKWWDETRKASYESTDFHCIACGVHKDNAVWHRWLEGHELYEINYQIGRMKYIETVPLCHFCHCFIHDGRLKMLLDEGSITQEKYNLVMEYGKRVLKEAKLRKPKPYSGVCARWEAWRLVIGRKTYRPIVKPT